MNLNYLIFEKLLVINNLKAYEVSKQTGIPQSTFSDWKRGKSYPKINKLQKIASYFDVPIEYFLDEKEN